MLVKYSKSDNDGETDALQITLQAEKEIEEILLEIWQKQVHLGPVVCSCRTDDEGKSCLTFERARAASGSLQ